MLAYPETTLVSTSTVYKKPTVPSSFILTEFHALLLYNDHVKGVSLLNEELVFEDVYNDVSLIKV